MSVMCDVRPGSSWSTAAWSDTRADDEHWRGQKRKGKKHMCKGWNRKKVLEFGYSTSMDGQIRPDSSVRHQSVLSVQSVVLIDKYVSANLCQGKEDRQCMTLAFIQENCQQGEGMIDYTSQNSCETGLESH